MSDIDVSPEALTAHASEVDALMSALAAAAAYGDQAFDLRAFGIIGTSWSQVLHLWCTDAKNHVDTAAAAGRQIGVAMREMAASYEQRDAAHADVFRKLEGSLAGPVTGG